MNSLTIWTMTNLPRKPSRIDFEALDSHQIERILKTGDLDSLTPAEREYFNLMELVRGLRARMMMPGGNRIVTKAGIIKVLKSDVYGLSDWMARRVYSDALNFFYSVDDVTPRAWRNLYAERLDNMANLSASMGKMKEARSFMVARLLRGSGPRNSAGTPRRCSNGYLYRRPRKYGRTEGRPQGTGGVYRFDTRYSRNIVTPCQGGCRYYQT